MRFFVLLYILFGGLQSLQSQHACSVKVRVWDEGHRVVPFAAVELHELHLTKTTDSTGFVRFDNLAPGRYHFHIAASGFASNRVEFRAQCDKEISLDVVLALTQHHLKEFVLEEGIFNQPSKEAPLKIEFATTEYLQSHAGQTLIQQLDGLAGMNAMGTGTGIAKPIIRGFSFNRVAVVDRGIKQEGQQWGWDHGLEIDGFAVEHAELIKGPSVLAYGSDAVGGVLLFRPPDWIAPSTSEAQIVQQYRTVNGLHAQSFGLKTRLNTHWFMAVRHSRQDYQDYRVPADSFLYNGFLLPIHNGILKNTAGNDRYYSGSVGHSGRLGYAILTYSLVEQRMGFFSGAYGIPTAYTLLDDGDPSDIDFPSQKIQHHKLIYNQRIKLGNAWLESDLGFQRNIRMEFSNPESHSVYFPNHQFIEHGFDLTTLSWNIRYSRSTDYWHFMLGSNGQWQENKVQGFRYLLPNFRTAQAGLWAQLKRSFSGQWHAHFGLRADLAFQSVSTFEQVVYNITLQPTDTLQMHAGMYRTYANWSASAGLTREISQRALVRWNLGSSYRLPTVPELAANGIHHGTFRHEMGDSSLSSERGIQLDFSYEFQNRKVHFSASPFFYYFDRYIFLEPTGTFSPLPEAGQLYRYAQAQALQTGAECVLDLHWNSRWNLKLVADGVFGFNVSNGYPLPFIPPVNLQTEFEHHFPDLSWIEHPYVRATVLLAAPQEAIARNEKKTPGYAIGGLAAGATLRYKTLQLRLSVEVQNLLDQRYFVHQNRYRFINIPEPGRNLQLSAIFTFIQPHHKLKSP